MMTDAFDPASAGFTSVQTTANTPARLQLTGPVSRHTRHMTQGSSAGIKRNRGRERRIETKSYFSPQFLAALDEARLQSGGLSRALYLERYFSALGSMPVLSPALGDAEVTATTAA
jgi:hypothetical protein